jgi:ribonuclease VapC
VNVFDSSAVLAVIFQEPGADVASKLMDQENSLISSVNLAEVVGRLLDEGLSTVEASNICDQLPLTVVPLSRDHATAAGQLKPATRTRGLSLGDRCCLALASEHPAASVVTSDRPWAGLPGFNITLIR